MKKLPNNGTVENNLQEANNSLQQLDVVLHKLHVDYLTEFNVVPVESSLDKALESMRLSRISRIVYDRNEDNQEKLKNIYSAVSSYGSSCAIVLKAYKTHTDVFIGTQSQVGERGNVPGQVFNRALKGNFPGLDLEPVRGHSNLSDVLTKEPQFLANVLGVPSLKDEEADSFTQGIEKIVEALSGKDLCAVLLASPVGRDQLDLAETGYQELYSALSVMEQQQITLSKNDSRAFGITLTEGISKTITKGITKTSTITKTKTRADIDLKKAISMAGTGAVTGGLSTGLATGGLGAGAGALIGALGGFGVGLLSGSKSTADSEGESISKNEAVGTNSSKSENETQTLGTGTSTQYTLKNRCVSDALQLLDEQLERIRECKNLGMWNWGAYFFGQDEIAVKTGANIYAGLLSGESSGVERSSVSLWRKEDDEAKFKGMMDYIVQLRHPVLEMPAGFPFQTTLPASLISTKEMAVAMSLPQKSLPGIPIFDSVEFGRAVSTYNKSSNARKIEAGAISHLGSVNERQRVSLDVDSLTSHLFVTGSTGAGKSNTIYSLIHDLWKDKKIPFLIIEPAKGEYKNVFGGYDDVSVFGTNASMTPLLRVNPFSFPDGIHVTEHIDRLIEILNAVWPMYAAMPAILKAGVELAYEKMGWDLLNSKNKYGWIFPDFQDLLDVMPQIIDGSAYSAEMKGNYTGALVTRIESLTNGYYRSIFQKEELSNNVLFDEPCIVDLSRVGSSETKSLLMGIVFMKLQEYRMSAAKGSNAELKHITVLEEAHNLMRRTSFDQSGEGANLQGKAVEMISNAIAEMRTYGEGFIIADQAPGLLDQSVIRNTNTKIILRLPDWEDRELVGKAANLKDEQIEELARLRTGCAAVYQNDWQEAVLCQFDRYTGDDKKFEYEQNKSAELDSREVARREFLIYLLNCRRDKILPSNSPESIEPFINYFAVTLEKLNAADIFNELAFDHEVARVINITEILRNTPKSKNRKKWTRMVLEQTFECCGELPEELRAELIDSIFNLLASLKPEQNEMWQGEREKLDEWKVQV